MGCCYFIKLGIGFHCVYLEGISSAYVGSSLFIKIIFIDNYDSNLCPLLWWVLFDLVYVNASWVPFLVHRESVKGQISYFVISIFTFECYVYIVFVCQPFKLIRDVSQRHHYYHPINLYCSALNFSPRLRISGERYCFFSQFLGGKLLSSLELPMCDYFCFPQIGMNDDGQMYIGNMA